MWWISSESRLSPRRAAAAAWQMSGRRDVCRARLALLLVLVASLGCHRNEAAPSNAFAGRWSGIVDDNDSGRGNLEIALSDDVTLSGTWSLTIGSSRFAGSIAPVPTVVGGPDRQFTMTCGAPPAGGAVLLTASLDGGALQGMYVAFACPGLSRGTIRLARR